MIGKGIYQILRFVLDIEKYFDFTTLSQFLRNAQQLLQNGCPKNYEHIICHYEHMKNYEHIICHYEHMKNYEHIICHYEHMKNYEQIICHYEHIICHFKHLIRKFR